MFCLNKKETGKLANVLYEENEQKLIKFTWKWIHSFELEKVNSNRCRYYLIVCKERSNEKKNS